MSDKPITHELHVRGDWAEFVFWYPRPGTPHVRVLEVSLMDVRASDGIRIRYDFDRDGWSIEQASVWSWPADDEVMDADWQEVAFIESWARDPERHDR